MTPDALVPLYQTNSQPPPTPFSPSSLHVLQTPHVSARVLQFMSGLDLFAPRTFSMRVTPASRFYLHDSIPGDETLRFTLDDSSRDPVTLSSPKRDVLFATYSLFLTRRSVFIFPLAGTPRSECAAECLALVLLLLQSPLLTPFPTLCRTGGSESFEQKRKFFYQQVGCRA